MRRSCIGELKDVVKAVRPASQDEIKRLRIADWRSHFIHSDASPLRVREGTRNQLIPIQIDRSTVDIRSPCAKLTTGTEDRTQIPASLRRFRNAIRARTQTRCGMGCG